MSWGSCEGKKARSSNSGVPSHCTSCQIRSGIRLEIKYTINVMCLNHGFPRGSDGKASAMWGTRVQSLGWEDTLEMEMATYSSTLAWKIPWTEEPIHGVA